MKDYTPLFNELYVIDLTGFPFNTDDAYLASRFNIHRQYADGNNIFVLVGTQGGIDGFIRNYKVNHKRYGKKLGEPVLLKSLMRKDEL